MNGLPIVIFFLFTSSLSFSQTHDTLWKALLQKTGQPLFVWNQNDIMPSQIMDSGIVDPVRSTPIKMDNKLYLWTNGTGRLFELYQDSLTGTFKTRRLDATRFVGYNYMAFPFTYKGKIYNLGGYGYWKRNGLLRQFNFTRKEWDIVKLDQEIPVAVNETNDFIWMDADNGKIYLVGYAELNDGLKTPRKTIDKVMVLDLQKREWTELGDISSYLKGLHLPYVTVIAMAPHGLVVRTSYKEFLYLSFRENKIYHMENTVWDHFSLTNDEVKNYIHFFCDSSLYSYNIQKMTMDSRMIKKADLTDIHQNIYEIPFSKTKYIYSALLLLLFLPALVYRKKIATILMSSKKAGAVPDKSSVPEPINEILQLDTMEQIVLKLIYDNSIQKSNTGIEEINSVLGLSKRSSDVQKKLRSDCIQSINHKLGIQWGISYPIIDKKRADFDKRSFDYFISPASIDRVSEIFNTKANV